MSDEVHRGRANMLSPGEIFPPTTLRTTAGAEVVLPHAIATGYAVVLFYRGHW